MRHIVLTSLRAPGHTWICDWRRRHGVGWQGNRRKGEKGSLELGGWSNLMYEPKICGLHIFSSNSLRLKELVTTLSAPPHLVLQQQLMHLGLTIWDRNIKSYAQNSFQRRPKPLSHMAGAWLTASASTNETWMLRRQKEEKWLSWGRARAQLISLEDPNSIKCAISDAAQAERSGLSVIILSAQLRASHYAVDTRQAENAYRTWQWPYLDRFLFPDWI